MISHKKLNKPLIYGCLCEKVITTPSRYKLNLASFNLSLAIWSSIIIFLKDN